jgi:hypothetical protein
MAIQLTLTEAELTAETVGSYGMAWANWMEENHKKLVQKMKKSGTFLEVAKSVNARGWEYKKLLDRQYEAMTPRPFEDDVDEFRKWEFTRNFYTDSEVMRD